MPKPAVDNFPNFISKVSPKYIALGRADFFCKRLFLVGFFEYITPSRIL
jgi:hypothetical protein